MLIADHVVERRPFSGSPEPVVEDIASGRQLGVSELSVDFRSEALNESLAPMEHVASVITPAAERL